VDKYVEYSSSSAAPKLTMALDLLTAIGQARGDLYIVGHSAGADAVIVAVNMALSEGLAGKIKGVVLLDPYFELDGASLQHQANRVAAGLKGRVFLGVTAADGGIKIPGATILHSPDEHRQLSYDQKVLNDILRLMPDWK